MSLNHRNTAARKHISQHNKMTHLRIEERPHNKPTRKEIVGRNKTDGKISTHTKWKKMLDEEEDKF
jgi:hypothetical protein